TFNRNCQNALHIPFLLYIWEFEGHLFCLLYFPDKSSFHFHLPAGSRYDENYSPFLLPQISLPHMRTQFHLHFLHILPLPKKDKTGKSGSTIRWATMDISFSFHHILHMFQSDG